MTNYCLMFRDLETIETGSLIHSIIWLNCLKNVYKKNDGRRKRARERENKLRIANVIRMGRAREIERDEDQLRGTDKDGVFH